MTVEGKSVRFPKAELRMLGFWLGQLESVGYTIRGEGDSQKAALARILMGGFARTSQIGAAVHLDMSSPEGRLALSRLLDQVTAFVDANLGALPAQVVKNPARCIAAYMRVAKRLQGYIRRVGLRSLLRPLTLLVEEGLFINAIIAGVPLVNLNVVCAKTGFSVDEATKYLTSLLSKIEK